MTAPWKGLPFRAPFSRLFFSLKDLVLFLFLGFLLGLLASLKCANRAQPVPIVIRDTVKVRQLVRETTRALIIREARPTTIVISPETLKPETIWGERYPLLAFWGKRKGEEVLLGGLHYLNDSGKAVASVWRFRVPEGVEWWWASSGDTFEVRYRRVFRLSSYWGGEVSFDRGGFRAMPLAGLRASYGSLEARLELAPWQGRLRLTGRLPW